SKPNEVTQAVKEAIDIGYRHLDCAHVYRNEHEVGEAIRTKIQADMVIPACKTSLKNLGLDYLDLYLMHWPCAYKDGENLHPLDKAGKTAWSDVDYVDTWREMEKLVQTGLVRSIGVSNFNSQQIDRILAIAQVKPVVNQVECHPYLPQKKLMAFCKERDICFTAYAPLGSADRPWAKPEEPVLLEDKKLKAMAARLGRTTAQIVLRFQVQRGNVVLPKSVHKDRIESNSKIFDFELSQEDMDYLYSFDCNGRLCPEYRGMEHPHYPFNIEF
ncbi:UNVERIFIED_CONTAM: hypothetical protein B566_EDAN018008, partial [Ephemera danica]